jgi:nucleolar complex protein 2
MGKQTKRARKFAATGGVKARLEKGTVTNKGKLKRKRKGEGSAQNKRIVRNHDQEEQARKREESDFMGETNVGDMDIESFFESFADKMEKEDFSDDEPEENTDGSYEESSDDNDDEGAANQNEDKGSNDDSSESDSGSDDSGSDGDEDVNVAAGKMRRQMEKLQRSDPEFHKFLAENENSLLEFGEEEDEDGGERISDIRDEEEGDGESAYTNVDAKFLKKLEQGAFKSHGIKSLKKLVAVYKTACHLSDANKSSDERDSQNKSRSKKYLIDSSDVFDKLMVMCLSKCHHEFHYHLIGEGTRTEHDDAAANSDSEDRDEEPIMSKVLARSRRWNDIKPVFQSFMKSTLNLLAEAKEPELLTFILKALSKYVRFLTPFPRIAEQLLKVLVTLWSAPLDSSEDYQVVRLNAFIRIRQLALTQPFPFIETCLKKTYLAYANRSKFATSASVTSLLPTLTFMGNCVVELYSLDYHSSYQHAFVYIRQLALHLRSAIQKKTPDALLAVYCWQYIHCLKLWVAVITASCKKEHDDDVGRGDDVKLLRSLIFPLTEIIFGVARLVPTTRHLPLRLHCVRFLQQLAAAAEVFIPTTSILLDVLDAKEIGMKPKKVQGRAGSRGLQLSLILKLPKESPLRTHEQLEACISEVFLLLNREVELYRYSAGFPEFTVAICQRLRKFSKETKNPRWRAYSKGCIDLCERYSVFVVKERALLGEAPKDIKRLEVLKPTNEPNMFARHDASVSKEKRLEEVTRPATAKVQREQETTKEEKKSKQPAKKKQTVNKADLANTGALEQDDEVANGINWSDEEQSESSDEDSD